MSRPQPTKDKDVTNISDTVGPLPQHYADPLDPRRILRCHLFRASFQAESMASVCRIGFRCRKSVGGV